MKIVELRAENVKKLRAVQIKPDGSLVVIGGQNGAGKTSVLDSIGGITIGIATFCIIMAILFLIAAQVKENVGDTDGCTNETATYNVSSGGCHNSTGDIVGTTTTSMNATHTLINAASEVPGWVPLIVITMIGSVLLLLVRQFGFR